MTDNILFVCGIVGCVIGVATFVSGVTARSRDEGQLIAKVDFLVAGFKDLQKTNSVTLSTLSDHETRLQLLEEHKDDTRGIIGTKHSS